jgi:hypothetical protein
MGGKKKEKARPCRIEGDPAEVDIGLGGGSQGLCSAAIFRSFHRKKYRNPHNWVSGVSKFRHRKRLRERAQREREGERERNWPRELSQSHPTLDLTQGPCTGCAVGLASGSPGSGNAIHPEVPERGGSSSLSESDSLLSSAWAASASSGDRITDFRTPSSPVASADSGCVLTCAAFCCSPAPYANTANPSIVHMALGDSAVALGRLAGLAGPAASSPAAVRIVALQSLQLLRWRPCSQIWLPPHSLQLLRIRPC